MRRALFATRWGWLSVYASFASAAAASAMITCSELRLTGSRMVDQIVYGLGSQVAMSRHGSPALNSQGLAAELAGQVHEVGGLQIGVRIRQEIGPSTRSLLQRSLYECGPHARPPGGSEVWLVRRHHHHPTLVDPQHRN